MYHHNNYSKPLVAVATFALVYHVGFPQATTTAFTPITHHHHASSFKPPSTRLFLDATEGDNGKDSAPAAKTSKAPLSVSVGKKERFVALHQTLLEARRDMDSKLLASSAAASSKPRVASDKKETAAKSTTSRKTNTDTIVNPQQQAAVWIGSESAIESATAPYDKAIREAERLTEEAIREIDEEVEEGYSYEEELDDVPVLKEPLPAPVQDAIQSVLVDQNDNKTSFAFQRALLKARLDMELRAKHNASGAADAQVNVEMQKTTQQTMFLADSQMTKGKMESSLSKDPTVMSIQTNDEYAQSVEPFQELDDSVARQETQAQQPPGSTFAMMKEDETVVTAASAAIEVTGTSGDVETVPTKTVFQSRPVVADPATTQDKPPSATMSPSDITSRIFYTLTPEQGVMQLRSRHDLDIVESALVHMTKATTRGGKAAVFALGAILEAATSNDVLNESKNAVTSLSAVARSIFDVMVVDETTTSKLTPSAPSDLKEETTHQAPVTTAKSSSDTGILLFKAVASCGTVVQHVGGMAGAFLGHVSRASQSGDAFIAATESTKECVSLLASTIALGIKQGRRAQSCYNKLQEVMPTKEEAVSLLALAKLLGIQQGERAQHFVVKFWEDMARYNKGASKHNSSLESSTIKEVVTVREDIEDVVASLGSINADEAVVDECIETKTIVGESVEIKTDDLLSESIDTNPDPQAKLKDVSNLGTANEEVFFFAKWE